MMTRQCDDVEIDFDIGKSNTNPCSLYNSPLRMVLIGPHRRLGYFRPETLTVPAAKDG